MAEPAFRNAKYCTTGETKQWLGVTLHRIRAVADIAALGITAGTLGGWIEGEKNLQVCGNAWVSGDARVYGDARVSGDARVYGNARVSGDVWVYGNAWVSGNARVYGDAQVCGDARVYGRNHLGWFSCVGSENGTLCWFLTKERTVHVSRGCFSGSLAEFSAAVEARHGDNAHVQQYRLLIQFIELRATEAIASLSALEAEAA